MTVNLTTTYQRLHLCKISLLSLVMQTMKPDKINLWVSADPYLSDLGIKDRSVLEDVIRSLPENYQSLVELKWVPNTGPYRKLLPILRESQDEDIIVTADDDIYYGDKWLATLLQSHLSSPDKVVAARVRLEKSNFFSARQSYVFWPLATKSVTLSDGYIITFGGGAIFKRRTFNYRDIEDESYIHIAPTADDLWYSRLLIRNNVKVKVVPELLAELNFIEHDQGLINHNNNKTKSLLKKMKHKLRAHTLGKLGFPVCGNDYSYRMIEKHFYK